MNGIEWCSSPVVCGLCQVVAAGSEGSCELTDHYWMLEGLSVFHQHTCRSNGDGEKTDKENSQFIPPAFSYYWLQYVYLSQLPSVFWPSSPCPFSYCGDHLTCLLHLCHPYSGFVKSFLYFCYVSAAWSHLYFHLRTCLALFCQILL